jgi:hypothetical protein
MYDYPYNPFAKALQTVTADDLAALVHVAEGWYVEYKRAPIAIPDIAKQLSAFANQYGGWLLFGVEAADRSRMASAFPGMSDSETGALSLRIREATSSHIAPAVLYEEHVVRGPCKPINLKEGHSILIVGIPQGVDPPYVHSSGRIFRRLGDQSKPKEETDRHSLDLLWERGKRFRRKVSRRFRAIPELPEAQRDSAWAFVFLAPDLRLAAPDTLLSFDEFRTLAMNRGNTIAGPSAPLEEVRSTQLGYAARQVERNNPELATMTFRWWHNGVVRLDIPINTWSSDDFLRHGGHYKCGNDFLHQLHSQHHDNAQICDLSMLVMGLIALGNLYRHLLTCTGDKRRLFATFELHNVFYRIPFFNSARYISRCQSDGVPIILDRSIIFDEKPFFDTMFALPELTPTSISDHDPSSDEYMNSCAQPYLMMGGVAGWILHAAGVVPEVQELADDTELWQHHGSSGLPAAP